MKCFEYLRSLFLSDVSPRFRDIPSSRFTEPVPEIVEGREVTGFHRDHSVVRGAPDVGVFGDYLNVFGQVLLELLPACRRFLLVGFGQGSYAIEDQECKYQRTIPWLALIDRLG